MADIRLFPERKSEVIRDKVRNLISDMSYKDLDVLQNDRVGGFKFPNMPSILADYFHEWNGHYGRGETGLSHENIQETYASFYEYIVDDPDGWDQEQVDMARALLVRGEVGPVRNLPVLPRG